MRTVFLLVAVALLGSVCLAAAGYRGKAPFLSPSEVERILKLRNQLSERDVGRNTYVDYHDSLKPQEHDQNLQQWQEFSATYNSNYMHMFDMLKEAVKGRENLFRYSYF